MPNDLFRGKTFDDFLLEPMEGVVARRADVCLKSRFSKNIPLNFPVVAANMDTVTGPEMCVAMAQEGGMGILPRSGAISIEKQADGVRRVKRAENFIIPKPYTIHFKSTVAEARDKMQKKKVGTLLAEDGEGHLMGILSVTQIALCSNETDLVEDWMAYSKNLDQISTTTRILSVGMAVDALRAKKVGKLVLVDDQGYTIRGLITSKDIASLNVHSQANKDEKGRLRVGAAIGATGDYLERAGELIRAGVDVLVMDIAHAHNVAVIKPAVENFRERLGDFELVVGNVATIAGAKFLVKLGVQGIKVGIGSGHGCRTRLETAVGVPQVHAIRAAWNGTQREDLPFISDGGVRVPGHIALALLLGASSVMLGSFLAGTDEAPGEVITDPTTGMKFKVYRGMTSPESKLGGVGSSSEIRNVEGRTQKVPCVGSVKEILARIRDGLQSTISYAGERSLEKARLKISPTPAPYLIPISPAASRESFVR